MHQDETRGLKNEATGPLDIFPSHCLRICAETTYNYDFSDTSAKRAQSCNEVRDGNYTISNVQTNISLLLMIFKGRAVRYQYQAAVIQCGPCFQPLRPSLENITQTAHPCWHTNGKWATHVCQSVLEGSGCH